MGFPDGTNMKPAPSIHIDPLWANPDALTSLQMPSTLFPCGQTQMLLYVPGWAQNGTNLDLAPSIHMGPVLANPDTPTSTRMLSISFPYRQTQTLPYLPGWAPSGIATWDQYVT